MMILSELIATKKDIFERPSTMYINTRSKVMNKTGRLGDKVRGLNLKVEEVNEGRGREQHEI